MVRTLATKPENLSCSWNPWGRGRIASHKSSSGLHSYMNTLNIKKILLLWMKIFFSFFVLLSHPLFLPPTPLFERGSHSVIHSSLGLAGELGLASLRLAAISPLASGVPVLSG